MCATRSSSPPSSASPARLPRGLGALATTALVVVAACRGAAPDPRAASSAPPAAGGVPIAIIDAHVHTDFTGERERSSGVPMTKAELTAEMREAGVVGAVAHTGQSGEWFADMRAENVVHCGGVGETIDEARIRSGLEERRYRCIKIYLGYVHRFAYDPAYEPIYALAEKHDVPVVFHTGDTYSTRGKLKYADPLTVDEVAVDHPKVTFVLAHCGNPWITSAAEVAYKNPNVYLDGSGLLVGDLDAMPPAKIDAYVVRPLAWIFGYLEDPRKLMFGTDWPLARIPPYVAAFKRAIPREHWQAVFHDNAARVFKLTPAPASRPPR